MARYLSERLRLPNLEMDAVAHRDGWDTTSKDEFVAALDEFTSQKSWVLDGNYTSWGSGDLVWPRADTFIWLDLPRWVVMSRVIRRTLRRVITGEEPWEGVKEPWSNFDSLDPHKSLIVWTWTKYDDTRDKFEAAMTDGSWDHASVHRLRSRRQVEDFLTTVNETTD